MARSVDLEKVNERLTQQLGLMHTQIIMLTLALEDAEAKLGETDNPSEPDAPLTAVN